MTSCKNTNNVETSNIQRVEVRTVVELLEHHHDNRTESVIYINSNGEWVSTWHAERRGGEWVDSPADLLPVDMLVVAESQDNRPDRLLQKIRPKQTQPMKFPWEYKFSEIPVSNIFELAEKLNKLSNSSRQVCALRGRPIVRDPNHVTVRQWVSSTPSLEEVRRCWLMIDFDDMDPANLPKEFDNVTHYRSFSASATGPDSTRQHHWYWLDRPIFGYEATAWIGQLCDASVFKTGQPIFVLPPLFIDGYRDPFTGKKRAELVNGSGDRVEVPEIKLPTKEKRIFTRSTNIPANVRWSQALAKTEIELLSAGIGARHETLLRKSKFFGCLVSEGVVSRAEATAELLRIGEFMLGGESGRVKDLQRTIRDGINYGMGRS